MTLVELYNDRNKDSAWFRSHASLGKGAKGRFFEYTNTNYRQQSAFIEQFKAFQAIENKPREDWQHQENHKQEVDKHRVINMLQSKLFKKSVDGIYRRTSKGKLYSSFVDVTSFEPDGKWVINYLFLVNGYYNEQRNYILGRTSELTDQLLSVQGLTPATIVSAVRQTLATENIYDAIYTDFFYLHSFYDDSDFLEAYLRADLDQKAALGQIIEKNLKENNKSCTISAKYQRSGNFNHNMLLDELRVFLLAYLYNQQQFTDASKILGFFVTTFYDQISKNFAKEHVLSYIHTNRQIFEPIAEDLVEAQETDSIAATQEWSDSLNVGAINQADTPEDYLDDTSMLGKQKIKAVYAIRKKQARILSGYKCALEDLNNCKQVYFTAKNTGRNYVELHHFIPREFRNDFAYSIEVLANYIILCPRCHRKIHLAADREREVMINALYANRQSRLYTVGLMVPLEKMHDYYRVNTRK